nr:RVP_2 domain-containing protein [Tanacetum cinerariifolium]
GTIGSGDVHVLIDNGSTYNFVRPGVIENMCLPVQPTKAFKVYIGSGETLLCENVCSHISLLMQGVAVDVDLYVLPMQGPDVVLGIQWLQHLRKDEVYSVYEIYHLPLEADGGDTRLLAASLHSPELDQLLGRVMSSPNHPTSDIDDAFSSNFPDYTPASLDYFSASAGNTSSDSLNNLFGLVPIASPTLSLFHDDPYMKVMHAYDVIISPPAPITPSTV